LHIVNNRRGVVYQAAAHPDFAELRPCYCFVPEEFISGDALLKTAYLASRWPGINCAANTNAVGSHVLPAMARPINTDSACPELADFLRRLTEVAAVKAPNHPPT
jgi:hypothetical protein